MNLRVYKIQLCNGMEPDLRSRTYLCLRSKFLVWVSWQIRHFPSLQDQKYRPEGESNPLPTLVGPRTLTRPRYTRPVSGRI